MMLLCFNQIIKTLYLWVILVVIFYESAYLFIRESVFLHNMIYDLILYCSHLFIEPKSMGKKLIIEPIEPRVYWVFFTVFCGLNVDTKG